MMNFIVGGTFLFFPDQTNAWTKINKVKKFFCFKLKNSPERISTHATRFGSFVAGSDDLSRIASLRACVRSCV
jgi:hypothetical protein